MGFGDPDHQHPLNLHYLDDEAYCFRCQLRISSQEIAYGCSHCNHFIHKVCFGLPQNMTHPLHSLHTLTLFPSPSSQITSDCNHCHEFFLSGYTYSCQECLKFNLHLKCFLTLNLETKHCHPLKLCEVEDIYEKDCGICGLLIDDFEKYTFACKDCELFIHFDCTFLPPKLKHRHVHELTFEYNFPEGSEMVYCDICLDKDDEELDRTLSYYYCQRCDYIAHVRCVTSQPDKVAAQFDHFVHEHPMIYSKREMKNSITCAACKSWNHDSSYYFCTMCNYALHKPCAEFPQFINHPNHKNHKLSLKACSSLDPDGKLLYCSQCSLELEGDASILQCSDCDFSEHLSCASQPFKHPFIGKDLYFSTYWDHKFRCNACGEIGDGFRMTLKPELTRMAYTKNMSSRLQYSLDLHLECFTLPGQIDHGCHSHPLYLVSSPTESESYSSTTSQCDICNTEVDPHLWVYSCEQCNYIAHLKCVSGDLLPSPQRFGDLSNPCFTPMCEKEKFRVSTKPVEGICSLLIREAYFSYGPVFSPMGFFQNPKPPIRDQNGQPDATDLGKPFTNILHCPKCEKPICAEVYSSVYDWVHRNVKASIYTSQNQTSADYESLALLDEKVVDELCCPVCNLLNFPPTYSCADCQIFFHKSCAELPRTYTDKAGHTFVLQSPSLFSGSLINCSYCKHCFKGYAYFCTSCEIGFDVTCALGAPLLKLGNQKHSLFALTGSEVACKACGQQIIEGNIFFRCGATGCDLFLHPECAMLPSIVKVQRRIHHHPLVIEPHLDLSVDDYICDVCEKALNPCIWVYRCSDICGDRATSHVSCIVTSNKKCHFIYEEECSYPHLENPGDYDSLGQKLVFPALAAALVNTPPEKQYVLLHENLYLFIDELEHEYPQHVTRKLMEMEQAEVLRLVESPDALRAKVAKTMKDILTILPEADDDDIEEVNDEDVEENDDDH